MNQLKTLTIIVLIALTCCQQLTIENQRPLTFKLSRKNNSFTLPLQVSGYSYSMHIDTGSSDFLIKGERTPGIPAQKYSCTGCISKNRIYKVSYMTGSAQAYEQLLPVTFGGRTMNISVLVAFQTTDMDNDEGILGLSYSSFA
jgi:hypothetical protein